MKKFTILLTVMTLASCGIGEAKQQAKEFASRNYGPEAKVECMTKDSDGDGYASCTIFLPNDTIGIECATGHIGSGCGNSGCRIAAGKSR